MVVRWARVAALTRQPLRALLDSLPAPTAADVAAHLDVARREGFASGAESASASGFPPIVLIAFGFALGVACGALL